MGKIQIGGGEGLKPQEDAGWREGIKEGEQERERERERNGDPLGLMVLASSAGGFAAIVSPSYTHTRAHTHTHMRLHTGLHRGQARWFLLTYMAWRFYSLADSISHMNNTASSQRLVIHLLAERRSVSLRKLVQPTFYFGQDSLPAAPPYGLQLHLLLLIHLAGFALCPLCGPLPFPTCTPSQPSPFLLGGPVRMNDRINFLPPKWLITLRQCCLLSSQGLQILLPTPGRSRVK